MFLSRTTVLLEDDFRMVCECKSHKKREVKKEREVEKRKLLTTVTGKNPYKGANPVQKWCARQMQLSKTNTHDCAVRLYSAMPRLENTGRNNLCKGGYISSVSVR